MKHKGAKDKYEADEGGGKDVDDARGLRGDKVKRKKKGRKQRGRG